MTTPGDISRGDPVASVIDQSLPKAALVLSTGDTAKVGLPVHITLPLVADAVVHSLQNPFDVDCFVSAIVEITTVDATETIDVGLDTAGTTSGDELIDGLSIATAGVFNSSDEPGTNGNTYVRLDKKGGTNDFLVWTQSAGSNSVVGFIAFVFHPTG